MSTNSKESVEQMVQGIRAQLEASIQFVQTEAPEGAPTVYEMEGLIFKAMLAIGKSLLALYLTQQAVRYRSERVTDREGRPLPYFGEKRRSLLSIFGAITFSRSYYWAGSGSGWFPLDAALNLPKNSISDRLREWREALGMDQAFHRVGGLLGEFLGIATSTRTIQTEIGQDGLEVEAYYAQAPAPEPAPEATLLIVQADGKGVPMVAAPVGKAGQEGGRSEGGTVRRKKGEKAGKKKEAIVTAVFTQAPRVRTPEEVAESLFGPAPKSDEKPKPRSGPFPRWYGATLEGKTPALAAAAKQAHKQDGGSIAHRIALTDGSEALQDRTREALPGFTLVLDFIHADEYLWKAANAWLGETAPGRTVWVKQRALCLLSGETQTVIDEFRRLADSPDATAAQQEALRRAAAYFERNQAAMAYDRYLALGWPIGTGVIEGACRHLVKDRCERSGMRWTQAGAEALLQLRCVAQNGDWDSFHAFRREQRHREVYGVTAPNRPLSTPELVPLGSVHPLCLAA